jgi:hypothetical protein
MSAIASAGLPMMKPESNTSFGTFKQINAGLLNVGSDFDGAAADGRSYTKQFSGNYSHRIFKGIGHKVPQEALQAFTQAIIDVDKY